MAKLRKGEMSAASRTQVNMDNLSFISENLLNYDWFIFFGTL